MEKPNSRQRFYDGFRAALPALSHLFTTVGLIFLTVLLFKVAIFDVPTAQGSLAAPSGEMTRQELMSMISGLVIAFMLLKDAALAFDLAKDKPVYVVCLLYLRQFCVCTVAAFLTLILFDTMAVNESVMTAPVGEMTQQELGAMIFGLMVGVHLLHSAVAALNDGR